MVTIFLIALITGCTTVCTVNKECKLSKVKAQIEVKADKTEYNFNYSGQIKINLVEVQW